MRFHAFSTKLLVLCFIWLLSACTVSQLPVITITPDKPAPTPQLVFVLTKPILVPTAQLILLPTATPDPYAGLSIDELTARAYGAGTLRVDKVLGVSAVFTRTLISYASDGLNVVGFMDVPQGAGPFPVVIVNHGYIDPALYQTLAYTTHYAGALAAAGYIVLHPNFRNYRPSDSGPNPLRVGFAVDVLNLIGLVRKLSGQPGPLAQADPTRIGLWGHSMGGGVSLQVLTVSPYVRAAVLYGAMSGDEQRNNERIQIISRGERALWDAADAPSAEALQRISPSHYLDRIRAAVSIHHGLSDATVPPVWSAELCQQLQALGKTVECFTYAHQPHTFVGAGDALFVQRTIHFFNQHLR